MVAAGDPTGDVDPTREGDTMPHLDWKVAGAAGLAAGITVGGFSLVSASGIDRAVNTVALAESQTAPAVNLIRFVDGRTTAPPAHIVDLASQGVITVEMPAATPVAPTATNRPTQVATPKSAPAATPRPTHGATPKSAPAAHVDDCASCTDCVDGCATCVDSVASVASVASVDSVD
jgi:hypothetical protein